MAGCTTRPMWSRRPAARRARPGKKITSRTPPARTMPIVRRGTRSSSATSPSRPMRRGVRAEMRQHQETGVGRNIVETIVGALVLLVAGVFVFYAFAKSDRSGPNGYEVSARFDGLKRGADVTVSGVKVGSVTGFDLDRKTYEAVVRMMVSSSVSLPLDTNAKVVSESLLGGMVVILEPGSETKMIQPDGEIKKTQGAVPLSELIAKFMFGSTGSK